MADEQWKVVCYESGTMNVVNTLGPKVPFAYGMSRATPWLYIFGPGGSDQSESDSNRYKVCEDIAAFLNGGNRAPELFSEFRSKCYTVRLTAADKCYTVRPSGSNQHRTKEHDDDNCNTDDSGDH